MSTSETAKTAKNPEESPTNEVNLTVDEEIRLREIQLKEKQDERDYQARAYQDTNLGRLSLLEAYMRSGLAGILVLGTIAAVFVGIIRGIPGSDLSQYLAPVTGLAGLAVGYFFGRGSLGGDKQSPQN